MSDEIDVPRWNLGIKEVHEDGSATLVFLTVDGSGDRRKITVPPHKFVRLDALVADAEDY